ncbi:MAG TPA: membrane protein insertion efficiency factor YidD [Acidobacteriota bacterium]|nr:membrane protein insertion efficiency factor YidD [Acidobacteriota bacterium]
MFSRLRRRLLWIILAVAAVAAVQSGFAVRTELGAIRLYQQYGSPLSSKVVSCRFKTTCSHYAVHALQKDGFLLGNLKIGHRLLMCSPVGWAWDQLSGSDADQSASAQSSE